MGWVKRLVVPTPPVMEPTQRPQRSLRTKRGPANVAPPQTDLRVEEGGGEKEVDSEGDLRTRPTPPPPPVTIISAGKRRCVLLIKLRINNRQGKGRGPN